jgi:hypothetical protein
MKKLFAVLLLLATGAVAQQPTPPQLPPPVQQHAEPETKLTPEQAKELFNSVDEILVFASKDTGLPIKHKVKRELASRDQVQRFIESRTKKEAERLERSELVLKKFGLLPRDFRLSTFLVELLREQVAGYYDEKKKTVYLLDWIPPEAQKSVLAHELTHALQDQNYGLEKWVKGGEKNRDGDPDESLAARQAVMEGQAMAVLVDYMLAPGGQSLLDSPMIAKAMEAGMMEGTGSPVFARAPLYLKEVLTFPYSYGLDFVRELLVSDGKQRAYSGVFQDPPRDTREIMQPAAYLAGQHTPPLRLPDFKQLLSGYEKYDSGEIGAFDTHVLLSRFANEQGRKMWVDSRGGFYFAARKHDDKNPVGPDALALVYVSRWSSPAVASRFAATYAASVPKRYNNAQRQGEASSDRVLRDQLGIEATPAPVTGPMSWTTEAGPVVLEPHGDMVLVVEGLDAQTTAKIRNAVFPANGKADNHRGTETQNFRFPLFDF